MIAAALAVAGSTATIGRTGAAAPQPKAAKHAEQCGSSIKAVRFFRRTYDGWQAKQGLAGVRDAIVWRCAHLRRAAGDWQYRSWRSRLRWVQEFDWRRWMPDKWQRIGACETGGGVRPGNFHHQNRQFVSFAGISRQTYDGDAAFYGQPPWNDERNPTPHQQFLAALGHYHRWHGFSGWGCRGA